MIGQFFNSGAQEHLIIKGLPLDEFAGVMSYGYQVINIRDLCERLDE